MPEEHTSPEEKLLRLIRGDKKTREKPPADSNVSQVERTKPASAQPHQKKTQPETPKSTNDYIRYINISLIVIIIIITVVLLADSVIFNFRGRETVSVKPQSEPVNEEPSAAPPIDNTDAFASRDLFRPQATTPSDRTLQFSPDRLNEFALKGIIAGDNPQAIIEDTKNQKTYFLYKGQSANQITVEDIQEDRVIIKINGELLELTL